MSSKWVVVGGGGNGVMVRKGQEMSSDSETQRLATGAVVTEQEISGTRMKYTKVSGTGPQSGWISISAGGKDLAARVIGSEGGQASDALTKAVSGAFEGAEAMAIYKSLSNKKDKAAGALLATIPELFLEEGNPVAAVNAGQEAVELFKGNGDKVGLAAAYVSLAKAQVGQEKYEDAATSANAAQDIFKEMGDADGQAAVSELNVRILIAGGNPEKAAKAANDMVASSRNSKDSSGNAVADALLLKSQIFLQAARFDEASRAASEAQVLFAQSGHIKEQAKAYMGVAYADMNKEYGQAVASAQAAAELFGSMNDTASQAGAQYTVASAYLAQIAIRQRTCLIAPKADTENCIDAAKHAYGLFAAVGNGEGQALAAQVLQTVLGVNNISPDKADADTRTIMAAVPEVKYDKTGTGTSQFKAEVQFNRNRFAWKDPIVGYHFTVVWEQQVEGQGQNKNAGYRTICWSEGPAPRTQAIPLYHSIKALTASCSKEEGPLNIVISNASSSFNYGSTLMTNLAMISLMPTCKITRCVWMQLHESPNGTADEKARVRQMYLTPCTLSFMRSARLEMPNLKLGYLGLDTPSWNNNRSEVIACIPDVLQSEESEIHFIKGTPVAPTLIQRDLPEAVPFTKTRWTV